MIAHCRTLVLPSSHAFGYWTCLVQQCSGTRATRDAGSLSLGARFPTAGCREPRRVEEQHSVPGPP